MGPPGDSSMGGARGPQDSEANRKNSAARPVGNTVSLRQDRYFYQLHLNRRNETLIGRVLGSAVGAENVSLSRIQSFRISDVWKDEIPSHAFLILETVCVIPK